MWWIFALAIIMPIDIGLCTSIDSTNATAVTSVNLTAITWQHAVNRKAQLDAALDSTVKMIEADVFMGKLFESASDAPAIPIMAHGPSEVRSDLSLEDFLKKVNDYNKKVKDVKGIKLDFKSLEAFTAGQSSLKQLHEDVKYPVWLNADIIRGPVGSGNLGVDAKGFLELAKKFPKFVLSVGWTTRWTDANVVAGKYTDDDVNKMIAALDEAKISETKQLITFPVRAGLVATSQSEMEKLLKKYVASTLTVWSSPADVVNVDELRKLIVAIGVDKAYLDVPKTLSAQLNLPSQDEHPGKSSANKIAHIGLLSIAVLILTKLF